MRCLLLLLSLVLASPTRAADLPAAVAAGSFVTWHSRDGARQWRSEGVQVAIAPAPCDAAQPTEGCRYDPVNNQAAVTITAPGRPPFRILSDRQASYYRVAVARLDRGDARPAVLIDNQTGGSGGIVFEQLLLPDGAGYRVLRFGQDWDIDDGPERLADVSGDGRADIVVRDGRFDSAFGCNACTPRSPRVFNVVDGQLAEVSHQPGFAALFARDMAALRPRCATDRPDRNGACVAYAADAARIGRYAEARRFVLRHYERGAPAGWWRSCTQTPRPDPCYADFPQALDAFLRRTGYLD